MAPLAGFLGGTYQGSASQADAERSINFYPERVESHGAPKSGWVLLSKPGFKAFAQLPTSPVQALYAITVGISAGRVFAVSGGTLYELLADGTSTARGVVGLGAASMVASQSQLLIVVAGVGFIFNLQVNTFAVITAAGWIQGASLPVFIDGYFITLEPFSQLFNISALNDGTSWSLLDFGDVEGQAGNIAGMIADHRQLWLFAGDHAEAYYNSGDANFPFSRLEGAFMEQGCGVGATLCKVDNTIMWLGANEQGDRIVWRAAGYTPQRISTHSVEYFLQSYSTISDATAYAYQEAGHTFYRLDFPSAPSAISNTAKLGASWLFDVASGMWHERAYWNTATGQYQADLARTHCFGFLKHLVGDYQSGNVYEQSMAYYSDNGNLIRRLRRAPAIADGGLFSFHSELRLLMQVGVGQ